MTLKFKPLFFGLFVLFWIASCNQNEPQATDENFSQEEIETIQESSQLNLEKENFEGSFAGKISNLEVVLTLKDDFEFDLNEGGKSYNGSWEKLEDGTRIELIANRGMPKTKFYAIVDANTWIALDKDGEFYEQKEEFLKRQ